MLEEKKETGLVISDVQGDDLENSKKGNQFVWVPVEKESDYTRNNKIDSSSITATTGYLPDDMVQEDNAENNATVEKQAVIDAHGYYISRFEAGNENGNVVTKKVQQL